MVQSRLGFPILRSLGFTYDNPHLRRMGLSYAAIQTPVELSIATPGAAAWADSGHVASPGFAIRGPNVKFMDLSIVFRCLSTLDNSGSMVQKRALHLSEKETENTRTIMQSNSIKGEHL